MEEISLSFLPSQIVSFSIRTTLVNVKDMYICMEDRKVIPAQLLADYYQLHLLTATELDGAIQGIFIFYLSAYKSQRSNA
jgi:hypothetical protein